MPTVYTSICHLKWQCHKKSGSIMALKSQTRFFISATYGLRFLTAFVQLLQFLHILLVIVKLIFIHWKPWESRHSFGCSCHHRQSAGDESICTVCHSLLSRIFWHTVLSVLYMQCFGFVRYLLYYYADPSSYFSPCGSGGGGG